MEASNNQLLEEIKNNLAEIREKVVQNPKNLEPVITELTMILNKFDPNNQKRPFFQKEIDSQEWINKIRETSGIKNLGIIQIRYKSEELSKKLSIPLPNSTKHHQDPLLYWYQTNWEELEPYISNWNS